MSLESAIRELARAMQSNQELPAVKELIRQRDEALEVARRDRNGWEWADKRKDDYWRKLETERRRVRSLRAYIKRLKSK